MMTPKMSTSTKTKTASSLFTTLIFISLFLTLCTIALSAYIRLAQSGLDCKPWPTCYGQIGITAEQQGITVLTQAGADMPHKGARVAHRLIASSLGITITLILLLSIKRKMAGQPGLLAALLLMAATLFLAILGYNTPSRTVPWVTLGNLGGGMFMAALLWWLGQGSVGIQSEPTTKPVAKVWAILALLLLTIQILSGAWVSANFAATACLSSLICDGYIPSGKNLADSLSLFHQLSLDKQGSVLLPEQIAQTINIAHRMLALICATYLTLFALYLNNVNQSLAATAKTIWLFLSLEVLLGIASVYFQLPLTLVMLHNLLAAFLLLCIVNSLHHLYRQQQPQTYL